MSGIIYLSHKSVVI